ncbi:transposase [Segatella copri]|uniref:transposase n=1 Tax=Segatella copri TaxID=165179 RepID=UPI0034610C21
MLSHLETIILTENFMAIDKPRKYACYIGVAPFKEESGTSVRKGSSVSKKVLNRQGRFVHCLFSFACSTFEHQRLLGNARECMGIVFNAIKFKDDTLVCLPL